MATQITESYHYKNTKRILFYPSSHRYKMFGEKKFLISVTAATGMLDKSRPLMLWAGKLCSEYLLERLRDGQDITEVMIMDATFQHQQKLEKGGTIGSEVHNWIEKYIKGDKPDMPKDKQVKNGILAALKWIKDNDVKFIESEVFVYSKKYKYVGLCDVVFTMGEEDHKIKHVGDWKTGKGIYMEMFAQIAAYQAALTEEHGTEFGDAYVLRLDKDTGKLEAKRLPKEEHTERYHTFLALLRVKQAAKLWESVYGYYANKK